MSRPGPRPGEYACPYLWRGQTYLGQEAVAAAAGRAQNTVSSHLRRYGNLDRLGVGSGGSKPGQLDPAILGHPVRKFGRCWPSQRALARDAGRALTTVRGWLRHGHDDRLLAALMAADARRTEAAMREAQMIDRHPSRRAA